MKKKLLLLIILSGILFFNGNATTVTGLTGLYQNGQVFFTWTNIASSPAIYKLYRSSGPIIHGSQLPACEYLGFTDEGSAINWNLKHHYGVDRYWRISSTDTLLPQEGLFVTTSVSNGSYYYAVTTVVASVEDTEIIPGANSLIQPIAETVAEIQPVFLETKLVNNLPVDFYASYVSSRITLNGPFRFGSGWLGFDFAVFKNGAVTPQALYVNVHAGGGDFVDDITIVKGTEVTLGIEDDYPDNQSSGWLGSNQNFNPLDNTLNTVPDTGTNFFYTVDRLIQTIRWVSKHYPVDSNRIHSHGSSYGANGAFFLGILHPEVFATVNVSGGLFDFGFLDDWNPECHMNPGKKNRNEGDLKFGLVATNLPESTTGKGTYDMLDGAMLAHEYRERNFPIFFSVNGKNDNIDGWTEKIKWYDSVNANHVGGYFFFDERTHGGQNKIWSGNTFDCFRFSKAISYPAFFDCSLNGNPGTGVLDGDPYGSINCFLQWKDKITDDSSQWIMKIYMSNLGLINNGIQVAPDSCTTGITPRQLQKFKPQPGDSIAWSVTHSGIQVQSGGFNFAGSMISIPGVKIFKDTCTFRLSVIALAETLYRDADGDGYGNANIFIVAVKPVPGYVLDHSDCNDANGLVHPNANEVCNSVDDDCDGLTDENTGPASTITPTGTVNACPAIKVKFTANGGSGISYQWYLNDALIAGATKKTYTSQGSEQGSYKVRETNVTGCFAFSTSTLVNRLPEPSAKIKVSGDLNICSTGSVLLKEKNGIGPGYQWNKNGNPVSGATLKNYTATTVGDYTVTVTNSSGCTKTSAKVSVFTSCRESDFSAEQRFNVQISPNPATDQLQVSIYVPEADQQVVKLQLCNILGQSVQSYSYEISGYDFSNTLSLEGIADGVYFLKVMVNGDSKVYPFVVKKN